MTNEPIEKTSAASQSLKPIVPSNSEVVKFDPEQDIKQGQKAAKALMKVVEITKPLKLNGKTYLYFEHWQTMAKFFRMTVGIEWTKQTETGWDAKAVVYQNGIIIGGAEASCNKDEKNWSVRTNKYGKSEEVPDFQRKSMAQTRAMGKALRSILGYIPVLAGIEGTPAEEMNDMGQVSTSIPNAPVMSNSSATRPITVKQANYIKGLREQKRLDPIADEDLRKMTGVEASKEIERLNAIQADELPTIEIEQEILFDKPQEESSVDKARRILNAKVPKGPYNYPEGD